QHVVGGTQARQPQKQVRRIGSESESGLLSNHLASNHPLDNLVEVLHTFKFAVVHRLKQRLAFAFALLDVFSRSWGRLQYLDGGDAPGAVCTRQESLRYDVPKRLRKPSTYHMLFGLRVYSDYPIHRLRGIGC